jgi:DNA mismatch endonuclease (patch repair protein)
MPDSVSPEVRSRIMRQVRAKDTRPELALRRALWGAGVRGWRCHVQSIVGTPDLAWSGRRVAVFVDSAWWHGHPSRWTPGRLPAKWDAKISRNKARDEEVNRVLAAQGWTVLRFWDFELKADIAGCVERVALAVRPENDPAPPPALACGVSGRAVSALCRFEPNGAAELASKPIIPLGPS